MTESESFKPNPQCFQQLRNMGVTAEAAEMALFVTGNQSAEVASEFLSENRIMEELSLNAKNPTVEVTEHLAEDDSSDEEIEYYKMVFVVNSSLNMGVGKIAAQVAHACLGLYRDMAQSVELLEVLNKWEYIGEKKIVLKGKDMDHLNQLQELGKENKIPTYLVHDAGHTQVAPNSVTVLSLFGKEEAVNKITGGLGLL